MMTNRIAIITGGSRGLGRNTAVNLARRGSISSSPTARIRKKPRVSSARPKPSGGKRWDFASTLVTFAHLTGLSLKFATRCRVGGGPVRLPCEQRRQFTACRL